MGRHPDPVEANPRPRNATRQRYQGLKACWTISVQVHETGEVSATLGKLDLGTKWMRFSRLSGGVWAGAAERAAALALLVAAKECQVDVEEQLRLF